MSAAERGKKERTMKRSLEDKKIGDVVLCAGKNGMCQKRIYILKKGKLFRNLSDGKPHSCYPKLATKWR